MGRPLDFVGIGAARAGSTWTAKCLQEHPHVFLPMRKELHLFNDDRYFRRSGRLNFRGRALLLRYYRGALRSQIRGEFTPRYMIDRIALQRIADNFTDAKIIGILRDPVERAFSQFNYFRFNLDKEPCEDFEVALTRQFYEDYVVKSIYTPLVRNVFEIFPRQNVKFLRYDEICDEPREAIATLFRFLQVDDTFNAASVDEYVNSARSSKPYEQAISDRTRLLEQVGSSAERNRNDLSPDVKASVFARYFSEDVRELEQLLELDLSAWQPSRSQP